jgi:hypothetical protein
LLQGIKAALHRHLNIERYNIWLKLQRFFDALFSVARRADNRKAWVGANFSG